MGFSITYLMNKHVLSSVIWGDKAPSFGHIEPFTPTPPPPSTCKEIALYGSHFVYTNILREGLKETTHCQTFNQFFTTSSKFQKRNFREWMNTGGEISALISQRSLEFTQLKNIKLSLFSPWHLKQRIFLRNTRCVNIWQFWKFILHFTEYTTFHIPANNDWVLIIINY